jgi:hypothetical protein
MTLAMSLIHAPLAFHVGDRLVTSVLHKGVCAGRHEALSDLETCCGCRAGE